MYTHNDFFWILCAPRYARDSHRWVLATVISCVRCWKVSKTKRTHIHISYSFGDFRPNSEDLSGSRRSPASPSPKERHTPYPLCFR